MITRTFVLLVCLVQFQYIIAQALWIKPKSPEDIEQVKSFLINNHIDIRTESHWFNQVSVVLNSNTLEIISSFPFEVNTFPVLKISSQSLEHSTELDTSCFSVLEKQMHYSALQQNHLTGKNVKIGVIDAGFYYADSNSSTEHLFKNNQVKLFKNFTEEQNGTYNIGTNTSASHGSKVLMMLAGKQENHFYGAAPDAEYYLIKTELIDEEKRIEEDYWIQALELLHEKGVRLVNTSLGYADMFDLPEDQHLVTEMDGKQTMISRAATKAIVEKNMILVSSAGNKGKQNWQILTAPADAAEVISVGAIQKNKFKKQNYSSIGPDYTTFVKPEIACYSDKGTSFSAPFITGIVACILQENPTLNTSEIKNLLIQSSQLYPYKNNYIGYGTPNCLEIINLIEHPRLHKNHITKSKSIRKDETKIKMKESSDREVVVYETKNDKVTKIYSFQNNKKKVKIQKQSDCDTTMIANENNIYIIKWKD